MKTTGNSAERTLIGASLAVHGDLTSTGDLWIKGVVDGITSAMENSVTICVEGRLNGHVFARKIVVEGRLRGNLYAEDRVILKPTCDVRGKIFSPRVSLEEGGTYKGRINMDREAYKVAAARTSARKNE